MKYLPMVTVLVYALFSVCKPSYAQKQVNSAFKALICKEWKLQFYEEDGEKFPPAPEQKGDRMIFYQDYTVKSIEQGIIQHGTWKYNEAMKILTVTDNDTKEKIVLKVINLTIDTCVLEARQPEGSALKMYMVPIKLK